MTYFVYNLSYKCYFVSYKINFWRQWFEVSIACWGVCL